MAGQVCAAVYAAVGAVSRRQISLERLDDGPGRAARLACHRATVSRVTHECRLATNQHIRQIC